MTRYDIIKRTETNDYTELMETINYYTSKGFKEYALRGKMISYKNLHISMSKVSYKRREQGVCYKIFNSSRSIDLKVRSRFILKIILKLYSLI